MFGLLARGVSAFVASVSGSNTKDDTQIEGSSNDDGRSITSSTSIIRRPSESSAKNMTATRQQFNIEPAEKGNLEEIVQFLIDNFAQTEAILASLKIEDEEKFKSELRVMLRDLVADSLQCSSSCVSRDPVSRQLDGVALACKTSIFDKQIDRLCAYEFESQSIKDAVEFLKFVFNKLDVTYYLSEHKVHKPIFVALTCVRQEMWGRGIGSALMNHVQNAAVASGSDGLIALCSTQIGHRLMIKYCKKVFFNVRYDSFKGEHKYPPIVIRPTEPFQSIYAMITRFE